MEGEDLASFACDDGNSALGSTSTGSPVSKAFLTIVGIRRHARKLPCRHDVVHERIVQKFGRFVGELNHVLVSGRKGAGRDAAGERATSSGMLTNVETNRGAVCIGPFVLSRGLSCFLEELIGGSKSKDALPSVDRSLLFHGFLGLALIKDFEFGLNKTPRDLGRKSLTVQDARRVVLQLTSQTRFACRSKVSTPCLNNSWPTVASNMPSGRCTSDVAK